MAQTVLQQVLILAAMMMLGFLLGKLGKVDRKGADLLSMLLLDVFFPCNVLGRGERRLRRYAVFSGH